MRIFLMLGIGILLLAGCASPGDGRTDSAALAAKDDALCRSYGAYPGTAPYVQCRLGLKQMHDRNSDDQTPLARLFAN